jgi:hypothetical protein
VNGDGTLSCAIDQIGSAGGSGVSSLNGKTGSLVVEGGEGISVETSEEGKVTIRAEATTGSDFEPQATITLPTTGSINSANTAFRITNNGTEISLAATTASRVARVAVVVSRVLAFLEELTPYCSALTLAPASIVRPA